MLLVKPQFEAERAEVSRGRGVVRDPEVWAGALDGVGAALDEVGAAIMGAMASPLHGADGNVEFLLHAVAPGAGPAPACGPGPGRPGRPGPGVRVSGSPHRAVALVSHPHRSEAAALEADIRAWLEARGHTPCAAIDGADLVVSIGGDGTMLRAVDHASRHGSPVLGINVGQLGYLAEVDPSGWETALERWDRGEARVAERMLLAVRVERAGPATEPAPDDAPRPLPDGTFLALNEVVVEKTPIGRMVRLGVVLDGAFFTTYAADGMIVATPTGSTAYSLSARGPIVDPEHRAIVLTPVAPHMLFDRALVLTPSTEVRLEVRGDRPATIALDGRSLGQIDVGDAVVATAADRTARLLTFGDHNFHGILKAKFGLEDR